MDLSSSSSPIDYSHILEFLSADAEIPHQVEEPNHMMLTVNRKLQDQLQPEDW